MKEINGYHLQKVLSFENDQDKHNMKISRSRSIWENCEDGYLSFGELCIGSSDQNDQNIYLYNNGNYNNIFNVGLYREVCLSIEEIEVFSVVKNNTFT